MDQCAYFKDNAYTFFVPIVPNGKNKILYIVLVGDGSEISGHGNVWIND